MFILLSLGDLVLTWWLLEHSGRVVFEGNPVADWWLSQYGWSGLAGFKASMVLLVIILTTLIARQRPRVATRTLRFACAVLVLVMLHSVALGRTAQTADEFVEEVNHDLEELNRQARDRTARIVAYFQLLVDVTGEVSSGQVTVLQAVERLAKSPRAKDGDYLQSLVRRHPGHSFRECLSLEIKWLVFWLPKEAA
jgi:hypothetical protein